MLIKSYKSAWSEKQKKLIKWVFTGLIIIAFLPSFSYIIEQIIGRSIIQTVGRELLNGLFHSIGMLIIGIAFIRISKNPWLLQRQRASVIMVYSHEGILIYSKSFTKNVNPDDLILLSGGFTAVTSMFKEVTKTSGQVKAIVLEGNELRIFNRKNFLCAILVDYNTQASELAHMKFTEMFENLFSEQLENFSGEISEFERAETITKQIFS
jgi:hypothetical protein